MERNQHSSSNFMNGFVTGALLGGGLVFLFGTKTGKKLLKIISEEGLENMSSLSELLEDKFADGMTVEEEGEVIGTTDEKDDEPSSVGKIQSSAKHFFRGVKKK